MSGSADIIMTPQLQTSPGSTPYLPRLDAVRTLIVLIMAFGYASTMGIGPGTPELGRLFGYEPSLFALQMLFFLSGWLTLRSLQRHGSGFAMLASRARRNLPLLATVTAAVAFIIYPWMRADVDHALGPLQLFAYFAQTVSCANPGQVMPGALDSAHYACLLQGAIWTFRWGAIFYIGSAIAWRLGLVRPRLVSLAAITSLFAYGIVHWIVSKSGSDISEVYSGLDTAFRLAYPFALGMTAYAWRDHIPTKPSIRAFFIALPIVIAGLNYVYAPWTPVIEMFTTLGLCGFTLALVQSRTHYLRVLDSWPPLALPLFLLNWPLAQVWLYIRPDITPWALVAATLLTAMLFAAMCLPVLRKRNRSTASFA